MALGETTYVNVSGMMLNEIVTPFRNPRLITYLSDGSTASVQEDGNSIYVSTGDEQFIQLIIKDGDVTGAPGISLALIPGEDVRAQTIVLRLEAGNVPMPFAQQSEPLKSSSYADLIRELMRAAAKQELPAGFTEDARWDAPITQVGEVSAVPMRRAVGSIYAIEYYSVTNGGPAAVELVEPNFKEAGVRAIAFLDELILAPGQTSTMVWVRDL